MTYDFDDPNKFEDDYDATAAKRNAGKEPESNEFSIGRSDTKASAKSARSYISNLSEVNKNNLSRFGRNKLIFLIFNAIYTLAGIGLTFFCIAILTNKLDMARMIMFLRQDIMVVLTTGALCQTLLGFFGMFGALTHRKKFLAVYLLLLWVVGGIFMTNGFLAYKEVYSFQFEANMSTLWTKLGSKQVTIQNKLECCGYYSDIDRPFVDSKCAGFVSSAPPDGTLAKRSVSKLMKRQDYDPNPNIVTSIPGCHDNWIQFLTNWYQFVYLYSFLMVPYSLTTFVTGLLAVNHLYVN